MGRPPKHPTPAPAAEPTPGAGVLVDGEKGPRRGVEVADLEPRTRKHLANGALGEPTKMGRVENTGGLIVEAPRQEAETHTPVRDIRNRGNHLTTGPKKAMGELERLDGLGQMLEHVGEEHCVEASERAEKIRREGGFAHIEAPFSCDGRAPGLRLETDELGVPVLREEREHRARATADVEDAGAAREKLQNHPRGLEGVRLLRSIAFENGLLEQESAGQFVGLKIR